MQPSSCAGLISIIRDNSTPKLIELELEECLITFERITQYPPIEKGDAKLEQILIGLQFRP